MPRCICLIAKGNRIFRPSLRKISDRNGGSERCGTRRRDAIRGHRIDPNGDRGCGVGRRRLAKRDVSGRRGIGRIANGDSRLPCCRRRVSESDGTLPIGGIVGADSDGAGAGPEPDAVAVRCFDLVTDHYTSGCLALSSLNDRGTIAGCEGDVASTMAMLWAKLLTGRLGWMANPAEIDRVTGVVELAHCTVPLSLVQGYRLATHFESGVGVALVGELPAGPVTMVRLGGDALQHLWCADGEAVLTTPRPDRCRTQLDVHIDPTAAGEVLDHPLGNHVVVLYGHHAATLRAWWQEMIAG